MIVLPNTPPTPKSWSGSGLNTQLLSIRASLSSSIPASHGETVRYAVQLEEYLDALFTHLANNCELNIADIRNKASDVVLCDVLPWSNVVGEKERFKKSKIDWTLSAEMEVVIASTAFMYCRLGAELTNELIAAEATESPKEMDQKWKLVTNYYKKAIAMAATGSQFSSLLCPIIFVLLDKIGNIGLQMSILCKFSWQNRNSFNEHETFSLNNNGVLCRVAIYVLDEVTSCIKLVAELQQQKEFFELNYKGWNTYLGVIQKYASAYSGLFLSIEYYQKNKVGQAIGLINFALLQLQSKNVTTVKPKKSKVLARFKTTVVSKRNEHYIAGLQLITSLNIDKLVFLELSGIVLTDLSYLFDQLVQCRLKYTKENDNLHFDTITDWKDIHSDSRWPFGSKIPVSAVEPWLPSVLEVSRDDALNREFTGRGLYF